MSRSRHTGHGRCNLCGDAGAVRRARESAALDAIPDGVDQLANPEPPEYCGWYCECGSVEGVRELISVEQDRLYVPIAELAA